MKDRMAALAAALALAVASPLVGGCAVFTKPPDELRVNRVQFMTAYFQVRGDARLLLYQLRQACAGQEETPRCRQVEATATELARLDRDVLRAFRDRAFEVDWEKVFETLGALAGLAGKAL